MGYFWVQADILVRSLLAVLASEAISYRMVYRHEKYTDTLAKVERLGKLVGNDSEPETKKTKMLAKDLKAKSLQLFQLRYRSGIPTALVYMSTLWWLSGAYGNGAQAVGVLPLAPVWPISALTHRGLGDRPANEMCLYFFYSVCCMAIRENVSRALGFASPRGAANPLYQLSKDIESKLEKRLGL